MCSRVDVSSWSCKERNDLPSSSAILVLRGRRTIARAPRPQESDLREIANRFLDCDSRAGVRPNEPSSPGATLGAPRCSAGLGGQGLLFSDDAGLANRQEWYIHPTSMPDANSLRCESNSSDLHPPGLLQIPPRLPFPRSSSRKRPATSNQRRDHHRISAAVAAYSRSIFLVGEDNRKQSNSYNTAHPIVWSWLYEDC